MIPSVLEVTFDPGLDRPAKSHGWEMIRRSHRPAGPGRKRGPCLVMGTGVMACTHWWGSEPMALGMIVAVSARTRLTHRGNPPGQTGVKQSGVSQGRDEAVADRRRSRIWWWKGIAALSLASVMGACGGSISTEHPQLPTRTILKCPGSTSIGFELTLASAYGGQSTPEAAAEWDASHHAIPGFLLPTASWQLVNRNAGSAEVRSGGFQVHAIEGPDRTWQVDSGYRCGK